MNVNPPFFDNGGQTVPIYGLKEVQYFIKYLIIYLFIYLVFFFRKLPLKASLSSSS